MGSGARPTKFLPDPYFHQGHLPEPRLQYVAWLDLMGTSSLMAYSVELAATKLCKLHLYVAQQDGIDGVDLSPMNDGLFVVANSYEPLETFLTGVFRDHATVLSSNLERDHWDVLHLPVLRAAVAYGALYHGKHVRQSALAEYQYATSILLGEPMVRAHALESSAPPFGIVADDSVDEANGDIVWYDDRNLARLVYLIFDEYTRTCRELPEMTYPEKAMDRHLERAREYLVEQDR